MRINCVCAIVISPFTEFGLRERGEKGILFHGSLHTIAPIEAPSVRHQNAVLGIRAERRRRSFTPNKRRRHKRSLWSEKSGSWSILRPRFNSCPSCSVALHFGGGSIVKCGTHLRSVGRVVGNLINNRNCRTVYACMLCAMYRTCGERPFCFLSEIKLELLKRQLGKATRNICHCHCTHCVCLWPGERENRRKEGRRDGEHQFVCDVSPAFSSPHSLQEVPLNFGLS